MISFIEAFNDAKVRERVNGREAARAFASLATEEADRIGPDGSITFWRELRQAMTELMTAKECYRCHKWPCECADGITLIHGDAHVLLPGLPTVDVTITDPPYSARTHNGARASLDERLIAFDSISESQLYDVFRRLVGMTRRWVVSTVDWKHAAKMEDAGLPLVRAGVWIKPDSAPQFTGDRPATGWEAVVMLHREGKKRWNGGGTRAVWTHNCARGLHPTQKPLGLVKKWVQDFSDPGEVILDPFAGSGTTLLAAKLLGRKAIGIECDARHCETAAERLSQGVLFRQV